MPKRIMIVEDHEEIRLLYRAMFRRIDEVQIVGQESCAEQALEDIPALRPDLVLVDITLPGMDGIELTRRIRERYDGIGVLLVTAHETERYRGAAQAVGADGIICKDSVDTIVGTVKELVHV
jgi:DNA-binding NarL/FixJ family response regulator